MRLHVGAGIYKYHIQPVAHLPEHGNPLNLPAQWGLRDRASVRWPLVYHSTGLGRRGDGIVGPVGGLAHATTTSARVGRLVDGDGERASCVQTALPDALAWPAFSPVSFLAELLPP